jgi:hypothetical protein
MPTDACQYFYECENCKTRLKPLQGDCCVYCSYASVPCPPIQQEKNVANRNQLREKMFSFLLIIFKNLRRILMLSTEKTLSEVIEVLRLRGYTEDFNLLEENISYKIEERKSI